MIFLKKMLSYEAVRATLAVTLISVLSKGATFCRDLFVLAVLGLSVQLDNFYLSIALVFASVGCLVGLFEIAGVRKVIEAAEKGDEEVKRRLISSLLFFSFLVSFVIASLLFVFGEQLLKVFYLLKNESAPVSTEILRGLSFFTLFFLPNHCITRVFAALGIYSFPQVIALIGIIISISGIYFFSESASFVAMSMSAGQSFTFIALAALAWRKGLIQWMIPSGLFVDKKLALATVFYSLAFQLIPLSDKAFATYVGEGMVSVIYYTLAVIFLPATLTLVGPNSVAWIAKRSDCEKEAFFCKLSGIVILGGLLCSAFFSFFGGFIFGLIFRMTNSAVDTTRFAESFGIYGWCLVPFVLWGIAARVLLMYEAYWLPVIFSVGGILLNILLNFLFVVKFELGLRGLGMATLSVWSFLAVLGFLSAKRKLRFGVECDQIAPV